MARGGYRQGAGRKSKENSLKVGNFRLSVEDIKKIDRKGIGKTTSEKLRYIINDFVSEKFTPLKKQKSYENLILESKEESLSIFNKIKYNWENSNYNNFILNTNAQDFLKKSIEIKYTNIIENLNSYIKLKKNNWIIESISFEWSNNFIQSFNLNIKKNNLKVHFHLNQNNSSFNENEELINSEEEFVSDLYSDLIKKFIIFNKFENYDYIFFEKEYANKDILSYIEYENIIVLELEYIFSENKYILKFLKGFNSII